MDQPLNREERATLEHLFIEAPIKVNSYQNLCSLTTMVILLCFSSFYFGYCLTYLSTFSTADIEIVKIP
jgi:hypothetical protein